MRLSYFIAVLTIATIACNRVPEIDKQTRKQQDDLKKTSSLKQESIVAFADSVRTAILANDTIFIVNHCAFPVAVYTNVFSNADQKRYPDSLWLKIPKEKFISEYISEFFEERFKKELRNNSYNFGDYEERQPHTAYISYTVRDSISPELVMQIFFDMKKSGSSYSFTSISTVP